MNGTMMLLAVISLAMPSAFSHYVAPEGTISNEQLLNLEIAFVLLAAYGLYLLFSLKTHRSALASVQGERRRTPTARDGACRARTASPPPAAAATNIMPRKIRPLPRKTVAKRMPAPSASSFGDLICPDFSH
jgi:Ca2+/H+ antiporter